MKVKDAAGGGTRPGPAKVVVPGSPNLAMVLSPTSGSVGTVVHIKATGCIDATGLNHSVSYNPGNRSAGRNPNAVRAIASTLSDTALTASYTVRPADHGATHGMFYVQCGSSLVRAPFSVTR
jgi:hypothetical protein